MQAQKSLALVGGGCLGLAAGAVLGGVLGHALITIEPWQREAYYGFFASVQRVRGTGIGACVGGVLGMLAGVGSTAVLSRRSDGISPDVGSKSPDPRLE